ncbi:MAG: GntR family transcriptional regulator, partial [Methylobacteriaceae bacterium]|nr:GntR family transcriptional regulator [Methylobacteriaceae bacterium]
SVAEQILAMIRRGVLKPGDQLPSRARADGEAVGLQVVRALDPLKVQNRHSIGLTSR